MPGVTAPVGGDGRNEQLTYTAPADGTYYIKVSSDGGTRGEYVLSVAIRVHFETGEVVKLGKGDSLYFDSRVGHAYVSTSRQLARTIGATTSESNLMRLARAGD